MQRQKDSTLSRSVGIRHRSKTYLWHLRVRSKKGSSSGAPEPLDAPVSFEFQNFESYSTAVMNLEAVTEVDEPHRDRLPPPRRREQEDLSTWSGKGRGGRTFMEKEGERILTVVFGLVFWCRDLRLRYGGKASSQSDERWRPTAGLSWTSHRVSDRGREASIWAEGGKRRDSVIGGRPHLTILPSMFHGNYRV